jgi:hypothetical protein
VIKGEASAGAWENAWTAPTPRPQRGQPRVDGTLGGAVVIPRPLAVVDYSGATRNLKPIKSSPQQRRTGHVWAPHVSPMPVTLWHREGVLWRRESLRALLFFLFPGDRQLVRDSGWSEPTPLGRWGRATPSQAHDLVSDREITAEEQDADCDSLRLAAPNVIVSTPD